MRNSLAAGVIPTRWSAVIAALLLSTAAAYSDTKERFAKHGWWTVDHVRFDSGAGVCSANATYQSGTELSMMSSVDIGNDGQPFRLWSLYFQNNTWTWIKDGANYTVSLDTPSGTRTITMRGDHNKSLWSYAHKDLINALAMDYPGRTVTLRVGNRVLATMLLNDFAAAIRDTVHCVTNNKASTSAALNSNNTPSSAPGPSNKVPKNEGGSMASGFFVAPGYVLTNNHVVESCKTPIYVRYPNFQPKRAYVAGEDKTNDLG